MKKAFYLFAFVAALAACNNNSGSSSNNGDGTGTGPRSTDEDMAATNVQVVQNANGNMPDTTNSINISTEKPKDTSTTKGSAQH